MHEAVDSYELGAAVRQTKLAVLQEGNEVEQKDHDEYDRDSSDPLCV